VVDPQPCVGPHADRTIDAGTYCQVSRVSGCPASWASFSQPVYRAVADAVSSQTTGSSVARETPQAEVVSPASSEPEPALERAMIQFWAWAEPYMIAYHARQLHEARRAQPYMLRRDEDQVAAQASASGALLSLSPSAATGRSPLDLRTRCRNLGHAR
jgi:hypothetical protein